MANPDIEHSGNQATRPPLMIIPRELNDDLRAILGLSRFRCTDIIDALRASGAEIKRRSEDEQAAAIFWLLCLYADHKPSWREAVRTQLEAIADAANRRSK